MTEETTKPAAKRSPKKTTSGISITPTAMTLEQFRSYLKGITFVGGDDWHPNRQQWEAIVQMIDNLIPEVVDIKPAPAPQQPVYQQPFGQHYYPPAPPPQVYSAPSALERPSASPATPPSEDGPYRSEFI
jgi:hypothetical protein